MKSNSTGPALEGSIRAWSNDTLLYMSYLNNSESFKNLPRIAAIREELNFTGPSHKYQFTKQDVMDIIEYIELEF